MEVERLNASRKGNQIIFFPSTSCKKSFSREIIKSLEKTISKYTLLNGKLYSLAQIRTSSAKIKVVRFRLEFLTKNEGDLQKVKLNMKLYLGIFSCFLKLAS